MRWVDVERIRIRVRGPAAGWTPAVAAALGEQIARALAAQVRPAGGRRALSTVDAGMVRFEGSPSVAAIRTAGVVAAAASTAVGAPVKAS